MKGYKLTKPFTIKEQEIQEVKEENLAKVKVTKCLLTLSDVLRYSGIIETENVVLGSHGIGIVSETQANLFGLEEGKKVYIEPSKPCLNCYNCKNGDEDKCSELLVAGEDYDGFLSNFAIAKAEKLFLLPESVSDEEALFIGHISLALEIINKLDIQKGEYVAIVGSNNYSNILAQILMYYQNVPILLGVQEEDLQIAKDTGIYYVLDQNSNWQKEVSNITGGRMTKNVIYFSDSNIPVAKAFSLASYNANIVFTGVSYKNNPLSFSQAIKKQLVIHCINEGTGNIASSINLLANKAINISHIKMDNAKYEKASETLKKMSEKLDKDGKIYETIVEIG